MNSLHLIIAALIVLVLGVGVYALVAIVANRREDRKRYRRAYVAAQIDREEDRERVARMWQEWADEQYRHELLTGAYVAAKYGEPIN